MWELIRQNRRKSFILFLMMGLCLLTLGYLIGVGFMGEGGGPFGLAIAFIIWAVLSLVSYFSGDSIMLRMAGAKEVTPDIHPQLFNVVEEMKIAASLPAMPKVYIIDSAAPNAFATGRNPEKSAIAVTAGLLTRLNRDELQGVVAHEMSHILNRDILFMTFAGIMLGSIVLLSRTLLYGGMHSGGSRRIRTKRSSDGGGGVPIMAILAIVFAILAPILGHILYMAISRQREYLADATAVRLSRYPEGLASALEKISRSSEIMPNVNKVTAPLYISPPLTKKNMKASDLGSTHPPIKERIRILRAMSHGADFSQYDKAFQDITGKAAIIPGSGLKDSTKIPIRSSGEAISTDKADAKTGARQLNDLMRAVNQYLFVGCVCGLKLKLPPDFKKKEFDCPRCSRKIVVPAAEIATAGVVLEQLQKKDEVAAEPGKAEKTSTYKRQGNGWESFACSCGNKIQLSPGFEGEGVKCGKCGTKIMIE